MTFQKDEKKMVLQLITGAMKPLFNKTKQYFLPYLLDSEEDFVEFVIKTDKVYLGEDGFLYFPMKDINLDKNSEDVIIDTYITFKKKGDFNHKIIDSVLYVGVKPPANMVEAFRDGRYYDMYDQNDMKIVFSEHTMLNLFELYNKKFGIKIARKNYFFLKKAIYTITHEEEYRYLVSNSIPEISDTLDYPPNDEDFI